MTSPPPQDEAEHDQLPHDGALPTIPAGSSARRLPFNHAALAQVADLLVTTRETAPFRLHGAAVYRLTVPAHDADEEATNATAVITLTCWPSVCRLDVSGAALSVVTTGILAVDLIPGVEAIFRHAHGSVTIARRGRVMVRTGPVTNGASASRG